jgi:hypothetical protein
MKKKNKAITFILILVVILSYQILNPIPGIHAEKRGKTLETYPTTSEGVVEAFVKVDFDGISDVEIGDVRKRLQYTMWDSWPGWDSLDISLKYKVIKIKEDNKEAIVKVIHEYLGWVVLDRIEIERKTEEIIYHLRMDEGRWKIYFPSHAPYISVKTAIKILEWNIEYYKKDKEKVKEMRKNIEILKKYL